ncbi:MAG: hypothetical protein A2Y60_02170, partial [Chloroflexi bacterium RBG_13_54_9]
MAKFKPERKDQQFLLPPALEDFIPQDHLARVISEIVGGLDTRGIEAKYSHLGQNTYHPKIMLKLLFYGYATGVRSGRKIARACESDTAFMYLAQMRRPDFRTINDFRKNHAQEIETHFVEIVRICRELGMAGAGTIAIDGSKIKANASAKRSKDREGYQEWLERIKGEIADILSEAEETDAAEDQEYGDARGDELPPELVKREDLKARIEEVMRGMDDEGKTNLTDHDARFMKERHGVVRPSYNCQLAVAEGQVIVGADITTRAVDRHELAPMIERTEQNLGQELERVLADSGYASYDNYEYLAARGMDAYIPDQFFDQMKRRSTEGEKERYHKDNFTYDRKGDLYVCPEGKVLLPRKRRISDRGKVVRKQIIYRGTERPGCSAKEGCTRQKERTFARELRED